MPKYWNFNTLNLYKIHIYALQNNFIGRENYLKYFQARTMKIIVLS